MSDPIISPNLLTYNVAIQGEDRAAQVLGMQSIFDPETGIYTIRANIDGKVYDVPLSKSQFDSVFNDDQLTQSQLATYIKNQGILPSGTHKHMDVVLAAAAGISDFNFENNTFKKENPKTVMGNTAKEVDAYHPFGEWPTRNYGLQIKDVNRTFTCSKGAVVPSQAYLEFKAKLPNIRGVKQSMNVRVFTEYNEAQGVYCLKMRVNKKLYTWDFDVSKTSQKTWDSHVHGGPFDRRTQGAERCVKEAFSFLEHLMFEEFIIDRSGQEQDRWSWAFLKGQGRKYIREGIDRILKHGINSDEYGINNDEGGIDFKKSTVPTTWDETARHALAVAVRYYKASVDDYGEIRFDLREDVKRIKKKAAQKTPEPKTQKVQASSAHLHQQIQVKTAIAHRLFIQDGQFFDGSNQDCSETGKLSAALPGQLWLMVLKVVDRKAVMAHAQENLLIKTDDVKVNPRLYDELVIHYLQHQMKDGRDMYLGPLMPKRTQGQSLNSYILSLAHKFAHPEFCVASQSVNGLLDAYLNAPQGSARRHLLYDMVFGKADTLYQAIENPDTRDKNRPRGRLQKLYRQSLVSNMPLSEVLEAYKQAGSSRRKNLIRKMLVPAGLIYKPGTRSGLSLQLEAMVNQNRDTPDKAFEVLWGCYQSQLLTLEEIGDMVSQLPIKTLGSKERSQPGSDVAHAFVLYALEQMAVWTGVMSDKSGANNERRLGATFALNDLQLSLPVRQNSDAAENSYEKFGAFMSGVSKQGLMNITLNIAKQEHGAKYIGLIAAMLERQKLQGAAQQFLQASQMAAKQLQDHTMDDNNAWAYYDRLRDNGDESYFTRNWRRTWRSDHKDIKNPSK